MSPPSFRVAIPLAGFNLSGGVKSLIGVANALTERGHRVRILVPDYAATPPTPLRSGVRVRILKSGPTWLPPAARKLVYLLRLSTTATAGADLCLANYFTTAYAAWGSRTVRQDAAALAYNVRGYEPLSHGLLANASPISRRVRFVLAWLSYRLPLDKVATTEWLRDQIGDPTAYVVGHGIDRDVFRRSDTPSGREGVVVGTIARHGEAKGYPDFLRALELLPPDLPLRIRLAMADPLAMPDGFALEMSRPTDEPAMAAFYAGCDVFVFSSRAEGFGLPALEAMACGCAVVTTDCGGVRTFARPDENCLMVPVDDPAALARGIQKLVDDPVLRARLSASGVTTARHFGREAMLERFCAHLERLAARRRRAGSTTGYLVSAEPPTSC